jgi:hypothetical protein
MLLRFVANLGALVLFSLLAHLCAVPVARADDSAAPTDTPAPVDTAAEHATVTVSSQEGALPAGYTSQNDGAVRWTYPVAAEDEVRSLRALHAPTWRRLVAELGAPISSALDVRVARNPEQMRALVGGNGQLPGYADGIAFPEAGLVLLTLTDPDTFLRPDLQTVLAHELSHVVLHRAVAGAPMPRWFYEGVAVQQAQEGSFGRLRTLWEGTLRGGLLPLDALAERFPVRRADVDLAYAQSADFVGFMRSGTDERARFRALLRELSQRRPFPEAIEAAYHVHLGYMEREWRASLTQRFGRWPMLFMGLTSLWVLGAVLLVVGYMRTRTRARATLQRWALEEQPVLAAAGVVGPPPTPAGAVQSSVDDFFDNRHTKHDPGIPTIVHDGQSHTLH